MRINIPSEIPTEEKNVTDLQVLSAFDLDYAGLEGVKKAMVAGDVESAKKELVDYFCTRTNVNFLIDYRGLPLRKMDPDECPFAYQSSLGFHGSLRSFCLSVGEKMMSNRYLLPSARAEIDLGENLENMPHYNALTDMTKRHRSISNMFVRGQFFESLAVYYHENGDEKVLEHFKKVLNKFFDEYPLSVVDTDEEAERFQHEEDRTVMSVGWLAVVYFTILYTRLPYDAGYETAFEIIKRIWFFGIQFRRFDNDSYRPYNHHLWERGLVPLILGTVLPEIPDFVAMRDRGGAITTRHIKEDFNSHGGYNEHSIGYWSGAAVGEMLFRGVTISKMNGINVLDEDAKDRLSKTFDALAQIVSPIDRYPNIGDKGGSEIDPILALGVRMVDNQKCVEALAVRRGEKAHDADILPLNYCDDQVGFTAIRSGYDDKANYLMMSTKVNCGASGHNHMDMLSVVLNMRGTPIFGEPYLAKLYNTIKMGSAQRGYMYNMVSHNTVLAHGKPVVPDNMLSTGWGVYRYDSPVTAFADYDNGAYVDAYHVGYGFCRPRRKVLFANNGAVIVRDEVERGARYPEAHIQRWHLEMGTMAEKLDDRTVVITGENAKVLCVWSEANSISIYKPTDILCPDIYSDESELAQVIDVQFTSNKSAHGGIDAVLSMLVLDITDKEPTDIGTLVAELDRISKNISDPSSIDALSNINK